MIEDMGDFGTGITPPEPDPQPAAAKSRSKARGAAAGVGVALVVGAGGIAVATSGSPSTGTPGASPTSEGASATPAPGHPVQGGRPGFGRRGPGGMGGFAAGGLGIGAGGPVLHGTFVTSKAGGGYQTVQVQTGTVDAVTATSLDVTSKDGFKSPYVVPSGAIVDAQRDGISSVKKGDQVTVTATVSGTTATVVRVEDLTELQKNAPSFGSHAQGSFTGGGPGGSGGVGRGPGAPGAIPPSPGTGT